MKRGQGTTFSFEEFIKLAISIILSTILIIIIVGLYLWWASPGIKENASSLNEYENLIDLISAQEGDEWETKTIIHLGFGSYLEGFAKGETKAKNSEFERPNSCEGSCICLFAQRPDEDQDESYPLRCETVDADDVLLEGSPNPQCDLFTLSKRDEQVRIVMVEECKGEPGLIQWIREWYHS